MTTRTGSLFPGGPSRRPDGHADTRRPRLTSVAEIEARLADRRRATRRRGRRLRIIAGLGVTALVAFGLGMAVGRGARVTREELILAEEARTARGTGVDAEVNRMLMELWRMEDVEAFRNMGRTR